MNHPVLFAFLTIFFLPFFIITSIWLFKTRQKGYSWKETFKIEMYNSRISTYERAGYMQGYNLKDIRKTLPKRIKYVWKK
jgi:hypothetical protein